MGAYVQYGKFNATEVPQLSGVVFSVVYGAVFVLFLFHMTESHKGVFDGYSSKGSGLKHFPFQYMYFVRTKVKGIYNTPLLLQLLYYFRLICSLTEPHNVGGFNVGGVLTWPSLSSNVLPVFLTCNEKVEGVG